MKIAIFADMEGISGISGRRFVDQAQPMFYARGQRFLTWDINACVAGCFAGGADEVLVYDGHSSGFNILWEELDPRVSMMEGARGALRLPGIEEYQGLILLGYHARAGDATGVLEHTYSSRSVQNVWLNGRLAGEFAVDAAIAAEYRVPTLMVSGDDRVCAEALEWLPGVVTCQVKKALTCESAWHLPRQRCHELITQRAQQAVEGLAGAALIAIERPVTLRVEYVERVPPPSSAYRPELRAIDGRTVEVQADTVEAAMKQLL